MITQTYFKRVILNQGRDFLGEIRIFELDSDMDWVYVTRYKEVVEVAINPSISHDSNMGDLAELIMTHHHFSTFPYYIYIIKTPNGCGMLVSDTNAQVITTKDEELAIV